MHSSAFGAIAMALALMAGAARPIAEPAPASAPQPAPPARPDGIQPAGPTAVFRAGTTAVEIDALVTDGQGNVVHGLTQSDFQVMEDGQPQKITVFAPMEMPIERTSAAGAREAASDVQTNIRPFDGRLYLIVLDDLHTDPLRSNRVKDAASRFVERYLGDGDMAAVVSTSGRAEGLQDFTSNRRLLLDAIASFVGRKLRSSARERMEEYNRLRDAGKLNADPRLQSVRDPLDVQRAYRALEALRTIAHLADLMGSVHGRRKAFVFIGEGIDYNVNDAIGQTESGLSTFLHGSAAIVRDAVRDLIAVATAHNVSIYGIDPRGLASGGDIEIGSLADNPNLGLGPADVQQEIQRGQDSLRVLAEETGGFASVNTNDLDRAFARIVRDSSTYYVLGYEPASKRARGFHRIEVRVARPGLQVRARKGYQVPPRAPQKRPETIVPPDTSREVATLLNAMLPENGLKLAATATWLETPSSLGAKERAASIVVTIHVRGQELPFAMHDGFAVNRIEIALIAVDEEGRVQDGDRVVIEARMSPETRAAVSAAGFRIVRRLHLAPGRYRLRIGAREAEHGLRGSVFLDVPVPDITRRKLAMSGLLLTSRASAGILTLAFDEDLEAQIDVPPTTLRDFVSNDTLTATAEIYDAVQVPHTVAVTTTVSADDGAVVFNTVQTPSPVVPAAAGTTATTKSLAEIPLADMKPGSYVLRVEATPSAGAEPVSHEIPFRVVPRRSTEIPTTGSADSTRAAGSTHGDGAEAASFVNFAFGSRSNQPAAKQVVIRSQAEFEQTWQALPTRTAVPAIDFTREMLVGVFLGAQHGDVAVRIVAVRREGEQLVVRYRTIGTDAHGQTSSEPTSPFVIARVMRVNGPVRFEPM